MFKNVAAQKLIVRAIDTVSGNPKTGDGGNLTAYVSKDFGSVTVLGDTSATEMDATNAPGYYLFDLTQAETNGDCLLFSAKSSTSNVRLEAPNGGVVYTRPAAFGLVAGAAGGLFIAGTNEATTITTAGGAALTLSSTGANGVGLAVSGNGSGAGASVTGGGTGPGVQLIGGATSGDGLLVTTTSGNGFTITPTAGHGIVATANGTSKHGFVITGGTGGTSDGLKAVAGTGGVAVNGAVKLASDGLDAVIVLTSSGTLNARQALCSLIVGLGTTTGVGTTSVTASAPTVASPGTPGWACTLDSNKNHTASTVTPPV